MKTNKWQTRLCLVSYHVSLRGGGNGAHISEATIKLTLGSDTFYDVADGNGPVHALDCAIRKALSVRPLLRDKLSTMQLLDYRVRVSNPDHQGAAAKTKVCITFSQNGNSWKTSSSSTDVIEASLSALLKGFQRVLGM